MADPIRDAIERLAAIPRDAAMPVHPDSTIGRALRGEDLDPREEAAIDALIQDSPTGRVILGDVSFRGPTSEGRSIRDVAFGCFDVLSDPGHMLANPHRVAQRAERRALRQRRGHTRDRAGRPR